MLTSLGRHVLTAGCLLVGCSPFVQAQTVARRVFEVATIKPSAPDARATAIGMPPGGRLEIINMTLKEMMVNAYGVRLFQVSGGPGWLDSVHYDISAKARAELKREDVLLMLQSLLVDRFQLAFRRERPHVSRPARDRNGTNGRRLRSSKGVLWLPL